VENRVCLSRDVQVVGVTWRAATRIVAGVGDMLQRIEDDQAHVGYSVAGRSGSRVTPYAVCTVHMETMSVSFLVEPQNQDRRFPSLDLKTGSSDLVIWTSKSPR
jgi:anti-sigma factor RsiW